MTSNHQHGDRVGRYVIEALLGAGGMGEVYRAFDEVLRRKVALKLLHPESVRESTSEGAAVAMMRIRREARMAAALDHPNVVAIHDIGEHDGAAFIVMEHVTGSALRALVANASVPVARRVRWLADVARALAAAHRVGLVHRDVKPENVMVRDDGVIKVLDFGIARHALRTDAAPSALAPIVAKPLALQDTHSGTVDDGRLVGTPAYIAPELILHGTFDARSDQFAWGVLAYELLAGELPWGGNALERSDLNALLTAAVTDAAPPLAVRVPGLASSVADTVHRALAKDPADRFESMDEIVALLDRRTSIPAAASPTSEPSHIEIGTAPTIASGPNWRATPQPAVTAQPHYQRPPRMRWIASAAMIGVMAIGVTVRSRGRTHGAATHPTPSPRAARVPTFQPTNLRRLTFDESCEEYPSFTPDGRSVIYDGASGNDYHLYSLDLTTGTRRELTSGAGWQYAAELSPDGRVVAFLNTGGQPPGTYAMPLAGGSPARLIAAGAQRPAWSVDGTAIWAGSTTGPRRIDFATGVAGRILHAPDGYFIGSLRELTDQRVLARFVQRESFQVGGIGVFMPGGGAMRWLWTRASEDVMAVLPGDRGFFAAEAVSERTTGLWWVPLDGTPPSLLPGGDVLPTKGMTFSPNRDRVVWSTCASRSTLSALTHDGPAVALRATLIAGARDWSDWNLVAVPGGTLMAVVSNRSGTSQPWVIDRNGHDAPRMIAVPGLEPNALAVSSDHRWVAFSSPGTGIHVVPFDGSGPPRRVTQNPLDGFAAFSRDDRHVYFETPSAAGGSAIARVSVDGGAIETVVASGRQPMASPTSDTLAFVAQAGTDFTIPTLLDLRTGVRRPLGSRLSPANYSNIRFSRLGDRAILTDRPNHLVEIEVATGSVVGSFDSGGDQISGLTYSDRDILISRANWVGDLWIGEQPLH